MLSLWGKVTLYEVLLRERCACGLDPLLRESQRAAALEDAVEAARRPSEGRSEETKAAAEATPAAAGDAVDIEAGMAAFEARVAALNSQIEAVTAEQRP